MKDNKNIIKAKDNQVLLTQLVDDVKQIIECGLREAYDKVNTVAIHTYWLIGKRIVEEEQHGFRRAEYGSRLIISLAEQISIEYSKGFTARDLRNYRQLYLCFKDLEIWHTRVPNLKWSH